MKTTSKEKAEAVLTHAVGGVDAFNDLIRVSKRYDSLTSEQKEILAFLRACHRAEKYYLEQVTSYVLRNYHINFDYLIKNFKL